MSPSNDEPSVSVVIPSRNYGRFVGQAVESALRQRGVRVEITVVDDGSTDGTPRVLGTFGERIRVMRLDGRGVSTARNTGLAGSTGEFVVFLDADDLLIPDALTLQARFLARRREYDLVHGAWYQWDTRFNRVDVNGNPDKVGDLRKHLAGGNIFPIHAVMARRRVIEDVGGFDPSLSSLADWDLWLRLAERGHRFGHLPEIVAVYRFHEASMTADLGQAEREVQVVVERRLSAPGRSVTGVTFNMNTYLARLALEQGDETSAVRYYGQALRERPQAATEALFHARIARALARAAQDGKDDEAPSVASRFLGITDRLTGHDALPSARVEGARRLGLGLALLEVGDRTGALAQTRLAIRSDPWRAVVSGRRMRLVLRVLLAAMLGSAGRGPAGRPAQEQRIELPASVRRLLESVEVPLEPS